MSTPLPTRGMLEPMRATLLIACVACSSKPQPAPHYNLPPRGEPLQIADSPPKPLEINQVEHDPAPEADSIPMTPGVTVRRISSDTRGHFQFSTDSKWLAYQASDGAHVVQLSSLRDRALRSGGNYFQLTPDARWIIQGPRLIRTALDGGSPTKLAPDLEIHDLGHFVVSPDSKWIGFLASTGELVVAPIDGGAATRLPVPAPSSGQCHAGSGFVKAFSGDSQWLVYQHGCTTYEAIRRDGTGRRVVDPNMLGIEALAGEVVIGLGTNAFLIRPVAGGSAKVIPTPPLFGFSGPKVAPDRNSFAFLAADYALYAVDIATRRLDRVSPQGLRISSFVEFTPDGKRLLYPTLGDAGQRCEFRMFDLASRRDRALVKLPDGGQCFIKPAGNRRAVIHHWDVRPQGNVREFLLVDLETAVVTRLARDSDPGNYYVSPDGKLVAFDTGNPRSLSLISFP